MKPELPIPNCRLTPVAVLVAVLLQGAAWGQTAPGDDALKLNGSVVLEEKMPAAQMRDLPIFLRGDRLSGRVDGETRIEGDAELRTGGTVIRADRLQYTSPDDTARASGHVRINREGNVYEGPALELQVETFRGSFTQPTFDLLKSGAQGDAERVDFVDEKHWILHNARYSTCRRSGGPEWLPEWVLRATRINVDNEEEVGRAEGATLRFMDVPILPIPEVSFPLSNKRKSGFLAPSFGLGNVNGVEVAQPYYLNLAPNRDATLTGSIFSKRGVDVAGEYRYLETGYKGLLWGNLMPWDRLREQTRWGLAAAHSQNLPGGLGLSLNINRVSDDNYWKDFTRVNTSLTNRLLANDANLSWSRGPFSAAARALSWQTLQDPGAPIVPPYDRMPQLTGRYAASPAAGLDVAVDLDYTRFQSSPTLTGQPNAQRTFGRAQLSRPWALPGLFVTPKVQVHAANYLFDAPVSTGATSANPVVPTFSLDSGLLFERDSRLFGRDLRQTLEPRAFYVYTPYRNQNYLPNYDTASYDFNFTTIYTENSFVGSDRIADNNLLTLGLSSRLLDPGTGAQLAQLGIANRLRFSPQQVTLPGQAPVPTGWSDVLVGGALDWSAQWNAAASVEFDADTARSVRTTLGASYHPGNYRVFNLAYRLQAGVSESIDAGWQWPLNDLWGDKGRDLGKGQGQGAGRWYSVGRLNYSLRDREMVSALIGIEYDAGCWLARIVYNRLQTATNSANANIAMQLELVGFSRLGANPLKTLRDNISRYQYLREPTPSPSRFSNYD